MKNILTLLLLLVITRTALATDYYVDCAGGNSSDSNDGLTSSTPWKTIAHAQTSVAPGDTVNIASGNCGAVTFNSDAVSGTSENQIVYKGAAGTVFSSLVFSPSSAKPFFCEIKALKISAPYSSGFPAWNNTQRTSLGALVTFNSGSSHVVLKDLEIAGFTADDGLPATYSGVQFTGGVNHITLDGLDLHTVHTGILQYGTPVGGETGNVIKNSKIHNLMGTAIGTYAGLTSITNTIISDEIPEAYYPSHAGGSGLAMRGGNITIDNVVVKNYGLTRPIRWYQGVAGPDGYQNVNISNLLVYYTVDGVTKVNPVTLTQATYTYNKYLELIDVGNNFSIKYSTLPVGLVVFLATNNDGSGFSMHSNLIKTVTLNNHYATTAALAAQTCEQAFVKWDKVVENKNIYGNLQASGGGYLCNYNYFTPTSGSIKTGSFETLFVNTTQPNNDYRLAPTSKALNYGEVDPQATSMGHSLIEGRVVNGVTRGSKYHSAGVYESDSAPAIKAIGTAAKQ